MEEGPQRFREIRVALVLYGGVSLAIYENGVTRCFYDLVRRRGVFGILLDMLDASATVDVVAGTSAGGLNGLFLAAALESGAEFSPVARLWRRLGDMGELLCEVKETDRAESLLKGDYFHKELIRAFEELCTVKDPTYRSPGEMDVFITGTDLDGQVRGYRDGLGQEVNDKLHRAVFHLQHRPGRKSLGIRGAKKDVDIKSQAAILGTIGRITASFPVAFTPVKGTALKPEIRQGLDDSLNRPEMDGSPFKEGHSFVDGGVLDNKPFGPALRAIFYRMPGVVVDRRLFYVEPDPVPIATIPKESYSPLEVGMACSGSIPSHESITDDLEKLLEHNQRIHWLSSLQEALRESRQIKEVETRSISSAYVKARLECVARMIVLDIDSPPSAVDYPKDAKRASLLEEIRNVLSARREGDAKSTGQAHLNALNAYDIVFHLRRAFYLLYSLHDNLEKKKSEKGIIPDGLLAAMRMTGRVIKVLKIIFDSLIVVRDRLMANYLGQDGTEVQEAARKILEGFKTFLAVDQPHWAPLRPYLEKVDFGRFIGREKEFLPQSDLTRVVDSIWKGQGREMAAGTSAITVLEGLGAVLQVITMAADGNNERFESFQAIDHELYPAQFTAGIYELDAVEFVRISPADAQMGLSRGDARGKVAGDEFAHFAAFLRRDWRSNDILYGRMDGICQVIRSLLDDKAVGQALTRANDLDQLFTQDGLRGYAPGISPERRQILCDRWRELRMACGRCSTSGEWGQQAVEAVQSFREQLILAGQEEAFDEEIQRIYEDLYYQETKFGRRSGLRGADAGTDEALIEADARANAMADLKDLSLDEKWKKFEQMRIGSQLILGPRGQLPGYVVGEYATLAYLAIWGLVRRSIGHLAVGMLDRWSVKAVFRWPVLFAHYVFSYMQRERSMALAIFCLGVGMLLGMTLAAWMSGNWFLCGVSISALLGATALLVQVLKRGGKT